MAFTLPDFNLVVDIYTGPWLSKVLRLSSPANYAWGRRGQVFPTFDTDPAASTFSPQSILLLPPLTDIRSSIQPGQADVVEIPSGSGKWYGVAAADDVGKGFANEHRAAYVYQISSKVNAINYAGLTWPVPMT
jgi:hypothetical protein